MKYMQLLISLGLCSKSKPSDYMSLRFLDLTQVFLLPGNINLCKSVSGKL